jgi:hypothetical protein
MWPAGAEPGAGWLIGDERSAPMATMEPKSGPYRYVAVGSGWRLGVFMRLGTEFPDKLAVACVVGGVR